MSNIYTVLDRPDLGEFVAIHKSKPNECGDCWFRGMGCDLIHASEHEGEYSFEELCGVCEDGVATIFHKVNEQHQLNLLDPKDNANPNDCDGNGEDMAKLSIHRLAEYGDYECGSCDQPISEDYKFCPWCGVGIAP